MLTSMVCCHLTSIILGVGGCSLDNEGLAETQEQIMAQLACAFFCSICRQTFYKTSFTVMDSKMLGERFRIIRKELGVTQKQLAEAVGLTQSAMSRLENGDEIYASALLAVLNYYHKEVSLDVLFAPDFQPDRKELWLRSCKEELRIFRRQLDIMADIINTANETCLNQVETMKRNLK